MKVNEILTKLIELVAEQPDIANMEVNACGADSVLRVFRKTPDGPVSGLSLEDMDYMNPYIAQANEILKKVNSEKLSDRHMEYLVKLFEEGVSENEVESFVRKNIIKEPISDDILNNFFESLHQQEEKLGVEIFLDKEDIRDEKHLNCLWYGGEIGKIKYRDYEIVISAYGDICLGGIIDGKEVHFVSKLNDGAAFSELGKMLDDESLETLINSDDSNNYLVYENNNWFEVDLIGPNGTWIDLSHADNVLSNNILECFEDVSEYFEYVDMEIAETKKEITFEQALKLANDINNVIDEITSEMAVTLHSFMCDGSGMNVFASVKKAKEGGEKWFQVYSGVEFDDGATVYADFEHSTDSLDVKELAKELQQLSNYYKSEEHVKELKNNPSFQQRFVR